jgi:hypothetical protein
MKFPYQKKSLNSNNTSISILCVGACSELVESMTPWQLIFLLLFTLANCISRQIPIPTERLIPKVFTSKKLSQKQIPYLLYQPKSYFTNQREELPLVVFLHGRGERGNDLEMLKRQALPKMIAEENTEYPFLMIAPQLPESEEEWYTKDLMTLIEEIESEYSVDENRIYLTGISLGGNGAWKVATDYPNKFAAVVPISGWGDTSRICRLKNENVWAFHGGKDTLILPERTLEIVERLQYCNSTTWFTIYPNAKHDAWTETYHNENVMNWMLEQRKKKSKEKESNNKKPKFTKSNPLKILVIGDSIGISISWGINEFVQANYHLTMDNFAKVSTGLSYPKFYNWPEKLDELLEKKKYDLGVVLIGANDPQMMKTDAGGFLFKTDEWRVEYLGRIKVIAEKFRKAKMNLYWVELPPMGPAKYQSDTRYINACFKEASDINQFTYLSMTNVLGNEKGEYEKYLPYRGRRTLMRADDDIHLTVVAAKMMVREILTKIFSDYEFPDSE